MNVTITGVGAVLRKIERLANTEEITMRVARRLCDEVGMPVVQAGHGGHASVFVSQPDSRSYAVNAEGTDVLFVEFGAGDAAGSQNALYDNPPEVAYPGSWSEQHSGEYYRTGKWHFGGREYTELPPHPVMHEAREEMVRNLNRVAREEFSR